jgi:abortive infection bacteriophage resistance protein
VLYDKPPLSIADQIALLRRRGLVIADTAVAEHWLEHTNYYRLRGYWLPFEDTPAGGEHKFRQGTTFEDVTSLYVFDRHLRLLVLDLIERIEVSVRTQWAHQLGMRHVPTRTCGRTYSRVRSSTRNA